MVSLNYKTSDKPRFNGTFKRELEGECAMWAEENIMGRNKKVVSMTLIVTLMFGTRQGVGCVVCAMFLRILCT